MSDPILTLMLTLCFVIFKILEVTFILTLCHKVSNYGLLTSFIWMWPLFWLYVSRSVAMGSWSLLFGCDFHKILEVTFIKEYDCKLLPDCKLTLTVDFAFTVTSNDLDCDLLRPWLWPHLTWFYKNLDCDIDYDLHEVLLTVDWLLSTPLTTEMLTLKIVSYFFLFLNIASCLASDQTSPQNYWDRVSLNGTDLDSSEFLHTLNL